MKASPHIDRIVYLSVPESIKGQMADSESFSIDPSIPIPAEIPPGADRLDLENLSWEMIVSGMLRVVAAAPAAEDADYYRRFVLAVKPDIQTEFTEAAILKARNGDFDLALEILAALRGLFPLSPTVVLNTALVLEERGDAHERAGRAEAAEADAEAAFAEYRTALAADPPFPNAFFNAGFFYMKRKAFAKAKECFARYAAIGDDETKKKKARNVVREIESRDLDDELFREAYDFIRLGDEERGIAKIRIFLERHPGVWNGWFMLGWALRRLERWDDAAAALGKALELGGEGCDTRNELAICLMERGDLRGARRELEKALRLESDNVKVISNLGVTALRAGNPSEAAGFFRAVLEIEPDDPVAAGYLADL
jgi:tetratricopeptide (TPR) repeat protein